MPDHAQTIAEAMWRFIGAWPDRPAQLALDSIDKKGPALSLGQMPGPVRRKRFVDGSALCAWPFAITLRTDCAGPANRLDAVKTLHRLRAWMAAQPLPDLGRGRTAIRIEMTGLPARAAALDNGHEDYQAAFELEYKEDLP